MAGNLFMTLEIYGFKKGGRLQTEIKELGFGEASTYQPDAFMNYAETHDEVRVRRVMDKYSRIFEQHVIRQTEFPITTITVVRIPLRPIKYRFSRAVIRSYKRLDSNAFALTEDITIGFDHFQMN